MKKLIFSFVFLVIAGFVSQTLPVYAAPLSPAAPALGAEEIKVLSQALSILKIVLEDMSVLIAGAPSPISNSAELSSSLNAIGEKLALISSTLVGEALASAEKASETKSAALQAPVVAPPVFTEGSAPLLQEEALPDEPRNSTELSLRGEQTATLSASVNQRNILLWVAVALLAIALGLAVWEWRKKREPKVARVTVQESQKPIVPMVSEDSIQGIPPDY